MINGRDRVLPRLQRCSEPVARDARRSPRHGPSPKPRSRRPTMHAPHPDDPPTPISGPNTTALPQSGLVPRSNLAGFYRADWQVAIRKPAIQPTRHRRSSTAAASERGCSARCSWHPRPRPTFCNARRYRRHTFCNASRSSPWTEQFVSYRTKACSVSEACSSRTIRGRSTVHSAETRLCVA